MSETMPERMHRVCDVHGGKHKNLFYRLVRQGRVTVFRVGGCSFCPETLPEIIRRIAAEDAAVEASRGKAGRAAAQRTYARRRAEKVSQAEAG